MVRRGMPHSIFSIPCRLRMRTGRSMQTPNSVSILPDEGVDDVTGLRERLASSKLWLCDKRPIESDKGPSYLCDLVRSLLPRTGLNRPASAGTVSDLSISPLRRACTKLLGIIYRYDDCATAPLLSLRVSHVYPMPPLDTREHGVHLTIVAL